MMDSGGQELFEQWKSKQTLMGRTVPVTTAPYSPPKTPAKRNVSVRNLAAGDPCITHETVNCDECYTIRPTDYGRSMHRGHGGDE